jgi:hypothetical protein
LHIHWVYKFERKETGEKFGKDRQEVVINSRGKNGSKPLICHQNIFLREESLGYWIDLSSGFKEHTLTHTLGLCINM